MTPYANLRRLCEDLGLAFQRQLSKLKSQRWATVTMMVTVGSDGKNREMAFISADTIPMWLATLNNFLNILNMLNILHAN